MIMIRSRSMVWLVAGALLTATTMLVSADAWRVDAAPGDADTTFVPLPAPCRLMDTRPAPDRVGTTATIGTAETETLQATGTNGNCTIPTDAVGLSLNVTALNATMPSFLTFWPGGKLPEASSLNPTPGQPPVPNAVNVALSASGTFSIYNLAGSVDVIVDINGYSVNSSLRQLDDRLAALETAVAGLDAAQPFTVASEPISSVTAQATPTAIRQVTVTAPVAGHVATIATGVMREVTDGHRVRCGMMDVIEDSLPEFEYVWYSPTGADDSPLAVSRVFDVEAGATATYILVCAAVDSGPALILAPQVTAVFTPAP